MSGDTLELSINHNVVGNRTLAVQSDQGITFDIGGYQGERQTNGNLTGHKKQTAKPWMLEGLQVEIDMANQDLEYMQAVSDSPVDAVFTWQHIDGFVYKMTGSVEGEVKYDSNSGYLPLALSGNGKAKKIG